MTSNEKRKIKRRKAAQEEALDTRNAYSKRDMTPYNMVQVRNGKEISYK